MNVEIEQQPHETVGEFEARRLLARMRMQALSIEVGGMAMESMAKRLERQAQELLDLAKELRR